MKDLAWELNILRQDLRNIRQKRVDTLTKHFKGMEKRFLIKTEN